ncbi:MAG: GAF domain-containing protein, partial [Pseudomonadales bacterium]|nr:GAF domain-containing protein [Pseudomonadales bacterium]
NEGVLTYANKTALDAIGLERKEVLGRPFVETPWWAYAETYRQQLRTAIELAVQGQSSRFDVVFESIDNKLLTIDFSLNPVLDAKGKVMYLVPSGHDVTKRRAAERALQMLTMCQDIVLKAEDELKLLQDVCRVIVHMGGYTLAWIGYPQQDVAKSIKSMAQASINNQITSPFSLSWSQNDPKGQGASAQAIRSASTVICEDIQQQQQQSVATVRHLAQQQGLRVGIALPLVKQQQVFGVLTVASKEVFKASDAEVDLLQQLADNLAYGVLSLRARQQNQRVLAAIYHISDVIALSTGHEYLQKLVLTMTATLGAHVGIITQRVRDYEPMTHTVVAVLDGKVIDNFDLPMSGTPCEHLGATVPEWLVSSDAIKQYPRAEGLAKFGAESYIGRLIQGSEGQAMGQIFVLFREPLWEAEFASAILKVFTARVAAELERQSHK